MKPLKVQMVRMIKDSDWDALVTEVYGKPYCFQQQDGCKARGIHDLHVSAEDFEDDWDTEIPIEVNGEVEGVAFEVWKNTTGDDWGLEGYRANMFWHRNFYPDIDQIATDLCKRGLLEAGDYIINIDW